SDLITLAKADSRVCLLPIELPMLSALAHTAGAVTVTGTIGFEAMCGKGRALSLRHPIIEKEFPAFHAESLGDAVEKLVNDPAAGVGNIQIGARLIQRFVNQSFPGLVADPISYPSCTDDHNVTA